MMKSIHISSLVICGLFLSSCQVDFEDIETAGSATASEIPLTQITPSAQAITQTANPTEEAVILEPTETHQSSMEELLQDGLWVSHTSVTNRIVKFKGFEVFNVLTWESTMIDVPDGCRGFIHGTDYLFCEGVYEEIYFFSRLTREYIRTQITNPEWVTFSSNGRYMLYEISDLDTNTYRIEVFDLISRERTVLFSLETEFLDRNWYSLPYISSDGEYISVSKGVGFDSKVYILNDDFSYKQIGLSSPPATWELSWSPFQPLLVYGAVTIFRDVYLPPNHIYVVDLETEETYHLSEGPDGRLYEDFVERPVWSPDGKSLLLHTENQLCIISLVTTEQICIQVAETGHRIRLPVWSDSGEYIAFISGDRLPRGDLYVYSVSGGEITQIAQDIYAMDLDW